jgi:5-methyltetrahydropteroyltriglutamate--homocysteine methyltransferase
MAHDQGHMTLEQLRQVEDRAILHALELQQQVGLDVLTDGEYRRAEFRSVFDQAVEGLQEVPAAYGGPHAAQEVIAGPAL